MILNKACKLFQQEIESRGGIDLLILGLGENGHLGFNQPGSPLGGETWVTQMNTELERRIRRETNNTAGERTGWCYLGIRNIMQARKIVLVAKVRTRRISSGKCWRDPFTPEVPASVLQLHPNCEFLFILIHDTMTQQEKNKLNYMGPFITMVFLFFIVGFLTTANTQFQGPLKRNIPCRSGWPEKHIRHIDYLLLVPGLSGLWSG